MRTEMERLSAIWALVFPSAASVSDLAFVPAEGDLGDSPVEQFGVLAARSGRTRNSVAGTESSQHPDNYRRCRARSTHVGHDTKAEASCHEHGWLPGWRMVPDVADRRMT